jgi:hypothetical protein
VDSNEAVPERVPFPIVGIGASAGGLAMVVVRHLDPHGEDMLVEASASARPQGAEDGLS